MADVHHIPGVRGRIAVYDWPHPAPRYLALLIHGYAEHLGRYAPLAEILRAHGATVTGPDHAGHGLSDGERVLVPDFEDIVTDVETVVAEARAAHPGLPLVVVGHSMGGLIAARLAQRYDGPLAALVLSAPVIGAWETPAKLLAFDEIPDVPISPGALSRDPAVGAAYVADPLVWHRGMKRATLEAFEVTLETVEKGGEISAPVLWLHGEEDRLVPLAGSRPGVERLSGGSLTERVYPGARHEVFGEVNQNEVFGDVTRFLDGALNGVR